MAELIIAFMSLLVLGFSGTRIAKWLNLPHSVFLVIVGVVGGLWLRHVQPETSAHLVHLFPEIILLILLPPLIFESAYNLNLRDLKKDLVPISVLAILGLCASAALVGFGFHYILGLQLLPSLVFGALISATDPVAVVSLFKEIGAPKRLNVLVEGESLINDGTAIVLFRLLLAAVVAPTIDASFVASGFVQFLQVALGGVAVGLIVAFITSVLLRLTSSSSSAQLGLTVAAAYMSFVLADHYLHVSGVIATMTVGLYLGSRARLELNKESLHGMHFIWEFLALSANIVVFFAVGITYDPSLITGSLLLLLAAVGIVYFARALAIFSFVPAMNILKMCEPISAAYQAVLVWGGLRGGLALGLVLILPEGFPHKQLFLMIATAVVAATLFVNALTIRSLLSWFSLDKLDPIEEGFYARALRLVQQKVFMKLEKASESGAISKIQLDRQHAIFASALPVDSKDKKVDLGFSVSSLLLNERHYYEEALSDGILSKAAYLRLIASVESRLSAFQKLGLDGLKRHGLGFEANGLWSQFLRKIPIAKLQMNDLAITFETLLHMRLALVDSKNSSLKDVTTQWQSTLELEVFRFHRIYPLQSSAVQGQFIAGAAAASSEAYVVALAESGILSGAVTSRALSAIHEAQESSEQEAQKLMSPSIDYLLHRVPIFKKLPDEALAELSKRARKISVTEKEYVVRAGDPGHTLYVVSAGMFEVEIPGHDSHVRPKLFTGDFFGEVSLLLKQPRSASVMAMMPSDLVEITEVAFTEVMTKYPSLRSEIEAVLKDVLTHE